MVLERSSDGQTAKVLGEGDALLATCDDAGTVRGADGTTLLAVTLTWPHRQRDRIRDAEVAVADAAGAPAGSIDIKRYGAGPFSKKLTLGLRAPDGQEVGELRIADKKGRALSITAGGDEVLGVEQVERDRSLARTVERWALDVKSRPAAPADTLAAAAVLRYGKLMSELGAPVG